MAALAALLLASQSTFALIMMPRTPANSRTSRVNALSMLSPPEGESSGDGFLPERNVDWDSEWRTELQRRESGTTTWRPEGREPPSKQELTEAQLKLASDSAGVTLNQLTGDWRFWMSILAAVSVLTALVSHPTVETYTV
eukprot:CAMPEP_0181178912 /NCGR_PEP_ID=MMETSP1096-20121128/5976_1 /TAXON_ID=156174 ORGANISM="Chrysochromulina ericina, Strain CCMP281" /NCGR_SAMPLE_ID=MMETSP1096 /ASSEMBLY_ACC=CAM_ASM_000453 /LENGTH=139 /DNA_ID=CAMNT_0023267219 /DNA_START=27 /DNA_END=446 /DNA_ORIENTATION=-